MKHGSAATTTIFPPDRNQTKTTRRLASCSGAVDPDLTNRATTHESPARPPARNSSRAWVCQIRCPQAGATSVWVMATDELGGHADLGPDNRERQPAGLCKHGR